MTPRMKLLTKNGTNLTSVTATKITKANKEYHMSAIQITELMGDGIGPELAESLHAVADSLPAEFNFMPVDWSLPNREKRGDDRH